MERPRGKENLDVLRKRLYERGEGIGSVKKQPLNLKKKENSNTLNRQTAPLPVEKSFDTFVNKKVETRVSESNIKQTTENDNNLESMTKVIKPKKYRLKFILSGLVFFIGALVVSSFFFLSGSNNISGENITINVEGPFGVGGGEIIDLQIAVSNQNTVPIESAMLIIEYPQGTQSVTEKGKELVVERLQLDTVASGEVINIPIKAVVFGEENEEKNINVAVEYRISGSNATFRKDADTLRFKISSSPVVLQVESLNKISSGQEVEMELKIISNSPRALSDLLIKAEYPFGFDFIEASRDTVSGKDTWFISELDPEEEITILIKGIIVGNQDDDKIFNFSIGIPNERDAYSLASIFSNANTEVLIEQPFLGVQIFVDGSKKDTVVVDGSKKLRVEVEFENTLSETIYDGVIRVALEGNALDELNVDSDEGFYDSSANTLVWDSGSISSLEEILPGKLSRVSFTLKPKNDILRTPQINVAVTVKGNRVYDDRASEQVEKTASRVIQVQSVANLASSVVYSIGPFTNTGPTPPVAEEVTQYTLTLEVQNGSNNITDGSVTASLPQYVTWLDLVTMGDDVIYNSVDRIITWDIGNLDANTKDKVSFQVSFLPSRSQVGNVPTILGTQRFKATDRFTSTTVRTESPALTTELFVDPDDDIRNGRVLDIQN